MNEDKMLSLKQLLLTFSWHNFKAPFTDELHPD